MFPLGRHEIPKLKIGMYMNKSKLTKSIAVATTIGLSVSAPVQGQDRRTTSVESDDIEIIDVVGTRRSIQASAQIKREANRVMEAITQEDIGLLPDISLAESLERVSGVTANEDRGQALQIIVRGLSPDLTMTTLNGRELAGQQDGREVNLGLFPSELVSEVHVLKSPVASQSEGGVAGSIDLRTVMPLSKRKEVLSLNLRGIHSDMPENEITDNEGYRGSMTYIGKFKNDTLGIGAAISFSNDKQLLHQYLSGERQFAPNQQWDANSPRGFGDIDGDGLVDFLPSLQFYQPVAFENKKLGGVFNIQWRPSDSTEIVFDAMSTEQTFTGENTRIRHLLLNDSSFSNLITDPDAVGSAMTLSGDPIDGALATYFDVENARLRVDSLDRDADSEFDLFGINVKHWTGNWSISADLALSSSSNDREDIVTTMQISQVGFTYDATRGSFPLLTNHSTSLTDPVIGTTATTWRPESFALNTNGIEDELLSSRLDFSRMLDTNLLSTISFGVRYVDRSKQRFRDNDAQGFATAAFSSTNDQADSVANANSALTDFPFSDFMSGYAGPSEWFYIDGSKVLELRGRPELGLNAADLTNATFDIDETYASAYVQVDFDGGISDDIPIRGNFGLRVIETETVSKVVTSSFTITSSDEGVIDSVVVNPINPDTVNIVSFENSYTNVLPSFNLVVNPHEEIITRFAIAKTMTRPNFQSLGGSFRITGATDPDTAEDELEINGVAGNPFLDAFEAWQLDVGIEWYPSKDIVLSAAYFIKDVDGFIVNSPQERSLEDENGNVVNIITDQPVNEDDSSQISGFEFGYSQAFTGLPEPFDGLGISMNFLYLDTDIETPFIDTYTDGNNATPNGAGCVEPDPTASGRICSEFTQAPNNFTEKALNAVIYYSKDPYNIRLAARYKDEYSRQGGNFNLPRLQKAATYLDFSFAYKLNKKLRLLASVNNLTDEPAEVYWQDPWGSNSDRAVQRYTEFGRKFVLGFRYNF